MVKELRQISRDPATLGMLLVVPAVPSPHVRLRDQPGHQAHSAGRPGPGRDSETSRTFVQGFLHSEYFDLKRVIDSESEIDGLLDEGTALVALVIPAGFGRDIAERTERSRCRPSPTAPTATRRPPPSATSRRLPPTIPRAPSCVRCKGRGGGRRGVHHGRTIDFRPRVLFNPELRSANFLVPGLIVLILIMSAVMSTALSIVREKERGTMEQIAVSPVRPLELIVGKTVPYLLIGLVAAATILAASRFLFGVTVQGKLAGPRGGDAVFLLGCLGFGVLLSTLSDSQQVAFLLSVLLTLLPVFILSGFVFPFRNMPPIIQAVSYLLPGRYYLAALRAIMVKGAGFWAFGDRCSR